MRYALAFVSAMCLANAAMAAPAPRSNSIVDAKDFVPAQLAQLELSEEFQPFNWESADSKVMVDRSFHLSLSEPAELQITDFMMGGDQFEILDNGVSMGKTSRANATADAFVATPEEALMDKRFSKAAFPLQAGEHELTISIANSPYASGTGALRVVQQLQSLYNKKGWDDDDDDDWEDKKWGKKWGDDKWDDKKWGDDKWGDDKWDDNKWDGKKWDDNKWDDNKWDDNKWDDNKWDDKKDWGWDKKKTIYVYHTVAASNIPTLTVVTATQTLTSTVTLPTTGTLFTTQTNTIVVPPS
ncbi:uncharacterized protein BYT42DRAFT_621772 [Radiomyces spectabilis]|uniref:uncharacterized protein n=1 Tax=Radiomyces spectabilis TaxID=64574 RepID=UPI00222064D0|nr:uncharacterized protein BYT42DRAFT_621772 [Radiomyces spectabilis]KAI8373071.1 hypothetical protein BYT42DRAFT_621772 [Radiomyces spectabilis]